MTTLKKLFSLAALLLVLGMTAAAQTRIDGKIEVDNTVHDFGDVLTSDGPLSHTFTITNIGGKPLTILQVVSSCGCTNVTWPRTEIPAGGKGTISATYSNDEGAYPFDKTLTAYFSDMKQPVILRLRGVVYEKKKSLSETYPVRLGSLGLREQQVSAGNLSQGQQKSGEISVANLSAKPIQLSFDAVSPQLSVKVSPNPVPANGTARISYTVTADRSLWGKNTYSFTPKVDGRTYGKVTIQATTKEDFSSWTKEQRAAGSNPVFTSNTFSFNPTAAGRKIQVSYEFTNRGKSTFEIFKVDTDNPKAVVTGEVPSAAAGQKGKLTLELDTTGMPKGEVLVIVTLTTNSPLRPVVNLFISGFIQ